MDESTIYQYYRPTNAYGNWHNFANGIYCSTWIVGNLEIHNINSMGGCTRCETLYCTTSTPPSLGRTGTYGVTALNWLTRFIGLHNIYVPVGSLAAYQNAAGWSDRANIISELEAPAPLSI